MNEIATKTDIETSQCSKMLITLWELGIVRKDIPAASQNSKKTIYALNDQMFRFWYRFVLPDLSRIAAGYGQIVCDEVFRDLISSHIGYAFEECAKQYLWRALGRNRLPFLFQNVGRWWGTNSAERREEEIDLVAYNKDSALFAECKWKNTPVGEDVLDDLMRKSCLLTQFSRRYYILFSKSVFTKGLVKRAEQDPHVMLCGLSELFFSEAPE